MHEARSEKLFRDRSNPADMYNDVELKRLCRLNREQLLNLTNELTPQLTRKTGRSKALLPAMQVFEEYPEFIQPHPPPPKGKTTPKLSPQCLVCCRGVENKKFP